MPSLLDLLDEEESTAPGPEPKTPLAKLAAQEESRYPPYLLRRLWKGQAGAAASALTSVEALAKPGPGPWGRSPLEALQRPAGALAAGARALRDALTPPGGDPAALDSPGAFIGALVENLPVLAGGAGATILAGPAGGGTLLTGALAGSGFMFSQEMGSHYETLKSEGVPDDRARLGAVGVGLVNAAIEQLPLGRIARLFKASPQGLTQTLKNAVLQAGLEGSTEGVQEIVSWLNELRENPEKHSWAELKERLKEVGAVGTALGFLTGGGAARVGAEGSRPTPQQEIQASIASAGLEAGAEAALPAPGQAPPTEVVGRPDLAKPVEEETARDLVAAVQHEREKILGLPVREGHEEAARAAAARFQVDPEGERARFYAQEVPESAEDVFVAKEILRDASQRALTSTDPAEVSEARKLVLHYYEQGSEQARAFRARADMALRPEERARQALRDALLLPPAEITKKLAKASAPEQRAEIEKQYALDLQKLKQDIQKTGIDLDAILEGTEPLSQEQIGEALFAAQLAHAHKAGAWDKWLELWRASILSGPGTHARNFGGNTLFFGWELLVQRPTEAFVNLGVRDPGSARFGEILPALRGALSRSTIHGAWQAARSAFASEVPVASDQFGDGQTMKVDEIRRPGGAIVGGVFKNPFTGKTTTGGRIIRTPFRMLLAADEMAKHMIRQSYLATLAHRKAAAGEGVFEDLVENPSEDMLLEAHQEALRLTFQQQLGGAGQLVLEARRQAPVLTYLAPFVTTPGNIIKIGVRKSPLGIGRVLWKYSRLTKGMFDLRRGKQDVYEYQVNEQVRDLAEQILAWGLTGLFISLTGEDDEGVPLLVGSTAPTREAREEQYRTTTPQSIRMGRDAEGKWRWLHYGYLEPLAYPITVLADMAHEYNRAAQNGVFPQKIWTRMLATAGSLVYDRPFMRGISDLSEAVSMIARGEEGAAVKWASNWTTSHVPNIIKSVGRATQPYLRDQKPRGEGVTWAVDAGKVAGGQAFPFGEYAPVRHDLWGRPIETSELGHPATDFVFRLFSPMRLARTDYSPVDRLIKNYNNRQPKERHFRLPSPTFESYGKQIYMTREQYQQYIRESGRLAHDILRVEAELGVLNVENPTGRDMERIEKILSQARRQVKKMMQARGELPL